MNVKRQGIYARYVKRVLGFCISLTALIILSPVMVLLTLLGAWQMKGNPFFVQPRPGKIGKDGKEKIFNLIKFRTMTNERDKDGNLLPDEKRLNGYGVILRKTSLDELPQLFNVLTGSCALIGPRPLLVRYLDRYSPEQRRRHEVRPGLTGYAQSHGRNNLSWQKKFELDVYYVDHLTFIMDVKVFFKTIIVVLTRSGISSQTSSTMEEFMGNDLNEQ
ncbi:sugar transferase [Ruminococcus sp. JL13D9]|uniref:sugar transferase n=1 Tax=Ruminococcus sp. JL13D9 TaxID=3233381 RepID=UPI00389B38C1